MAMRENTILRLKITSATLTPQDIEAKLGVKPDESWKIGDRTGVFGAVEKTHCYALISSQLPSASFEDHLRSLMQRLSPLAQKIGEMAAQATIKFICTLQRKTIPSIVFGRDDLRWLGVMGAQLDVEMSLIVERPSEPAKKPGTPGIMEF